METTTETKEAGGIREFVLRHPDFTTHYYDFASHKEVAANDKREVAALQKGRVTRLFHPDIGVAYLIDVTDREDPTTKDTRDVAAKAEKVSEFFNRVPEQDMSYLNGFKDIFASNNGIVAVITDKLDPAERRRIYAGVATQDVNDPQVGEITGEIIILLGFKQKHFFVPFSFDSSRVRSYMVEEIMMAIKEAEAAQVFRDSPKPKRLDP